jgi:integrase
VKKTFSTDRELKALKPAEPKKTYDVFDARTRNLVVRVGALNTKNEFRRTFCLLSRFPGSANPVRHALGEYGQDLTLEQARKKTDEWRALIRKGVDPRLEERRAVEDNRRSRDLTFGVVVEDFLKRHVVKQRRAAQVEREIRRELIPAWRDKLVTGISRADVSDLVEAIADRPAPAQARNVFGHVSVFFNWAIGRDKYGLEVSPCDRLKPGRVIGEKKIRQRVLTDAEIRAFWQATGRMGYPYGPLMRLLLITGQRKSEIAESRWSEFKDRLLTIPPERFKSNAEHRVPLSPLAIEVLDTLPRFEGINTGDFLFSTTAGRQAVNGFSKAKSILDREMLVELRKADPQAELPGFVIHDVRRSVRTKLSALRVQTEIAEMVIGHGKKGLARIYDQHHFEPEMRHALELWASELRSIVEPPPENVVPLERARI